MTPSDFSPAPDLSAADLAAHIAAEDVGAALLQYVMSEVDRGACATFGEALLHVTTGMIGGLWKALKHSPEVGNVALQDAVLAMLRKSADSIETELVRLGHR